MRTGSSSRVDRRAPAFSTAWLCAIVLVTGPLIAQPVAREKPSSPQVVALERRVDVPCDMPGPGWSNLFFAGDSTSAVERVAPFAEGPPDRRIDIVERTGGDGFRTYAVRVPGGGPDVSLDFVRRQPGRRCATLEVPVGRAGAPTRLQVAIPAAFLLGH